MNEHIRSLISDVLNEALDGLQKSGYLKLGSRPEIRLEPTKDARFGDVASNVALLLSAREGRSSRELGERLIEELRSSEKAGSTVFRSVELGGPGFINFFLGREPLEAVLREILESGARYGSAKVRHGRKVLIEFVSANPTGPLTLAHGRQAAVGDSLARIMDFCGFEVDKEYYLNDRGRQMEILGRSVYLRYLENSGREVDYPADYYQGDYIRDLARDVEKEHGSRFMDEDEKSAVAWFSKYAGERILDEFKRDLNDFGVIFDRYFSETELVNSGRVAACLDLLRSGGFVYEHEGALWMRSTQFGDDKDRVLVRSNGEMTYITPDAAYHYDKYARGYDLMVNIWGPDHHGYVPRLKSAISAFSCDPQRLRVIILQLATLFEGAKKLSMSTRRGEYVTLRQIICEVGADVGRYFFLMRRTDSHLDFDLELAKKHSLENPVYYIQYAHARICSIFAKYREHAGEGFESSVAHLAGFETLEGEEVDLIKKLGEFPDVLAMSSEQLDPYVLTDYLLKTAQSFHVFYTRHRVISESQAKTLARLALVQTVRTVLANGLRLLGLTTPETM